MAKVNRIDIAHGKRFFDGLDSYGGELPKWKTKEVVRGLVGIYELPEADFVAGTVEEQLRAVGCPFPHVNFDAPLVHEPTKDRVITGTGYTTTVRDQYGRIKPVIVCRKDVHSTSSDAPTEELIHVVRLLVLMHEMGHAEDIAKGVNYNHETCTIDMVQAEVYAHEFVCRYAKKLNYRAALGHYIENLEDWVATGSEVQRRSAEIAMEKMDIAALKKFAVPETELGQEAFISLMKQHGRFDDFRKRFASNARRG